MKSHLASFCVCNKMTCLAKRLSKSMIQVLNPSLVSWSVKIHWGKWLSSLFFSYSLTHFKQTATAKRFMHVDFGSLKNDPEQSCFFTLIMKSNIHEMDFPLWSPTHSSRRCVFAGVFILCLYSLVRLAWVNGILKVHFQATQLITQC